MDKPNLKNFQKMMNLAFNNEDILVQAFTHRSYLNENPEISTSHNERLEFLGDAVLELVVTDFLYKKFPEKHEGELTALRASLVNTNTISNVANNIGMEEYLLLSKGEQKGSEKARQYILANTFEAVIGSIYVDLGYNEALSFISKTIFPLIDKIVDEKLWQDNKSLFQEKAQEVYGLTPVYKIISEQGPDHDKNFKVGVYINDELVGDGYGKSKQEAEQKAADSGLSEKGWN